MKQTTRTLTTNALLLALICVLSYLNIPLPFISGAITGTTLAMCLVALVRPPKDTLIIIIIYLFMGAIGLPVFAGGEGFAKFIGPAAGYYISWPFAFPLLSYSLQKKKIFGTSIS
ncbi:biotin transporter BioY [Streptococcus massiliensis]|uniref:Biotin synthase n=1 Tax=Streptococcus massiliensis TaxID=313439 RepID=A0A380KQ93_9STRE|nr:biotin transporter BioY [Streptococcus massiliensis]SUN72174.1 biotin synthase [Streptococcus massiliensis]